MSLTNQDTIDVLYTIAGATFVGGLLWGFALAIQVALG